MYKEYFGFARLPFGKEIMSDDLLEHEDFRGFMTKMEFLKLHGGVGLLWGASGTGKSAGLRWFRDSLHPDRFRFLYFPNPPNSVSALHREIALGLELEPRHRSVDLFRQIQDRIRELAVERKITPIFTFDELQMASHVVIEAVRLFLNFDMDSKDLAILILAGQPEFRKRLQYAVYEPLIHRTTVQWRFRGIRKDEVERYVSHRTTLAGVKHPVFEQEVFPFIHQVTKGNLRMINHLAINALECAARLKRKSVGREIVEKIMEEPA